MSDINELSPEEVEDLLAYAVEADAKQREREWKAFQKEYEKNAKDWAARRTEDDKRREEERRQTERVESLLKAKGVRLDIDGCGCCGSPIVSIEIDGELIVDGKEGYGMGMIK